MKVYVRCFFTSLKIFLLLQYTCEVKACKRKEILDIVVSQFHHDQADQCPAM